MCARACVCIRERKRRFEINIIISEILYDDNRPLCTSLSHSKFPRIHKAYRCKTNIFLEILRGAEKKAEWKEKENNKNAYKI